MPALALTLALAALVPAAAPVAAAAAAEGLDALDAIARLAGAMPLASVAFERRLVAAVLLCQTVSAEARPQMEQGPANGLAAHLQV